MYASIGGAVGALSGELHGGANIQVMKMPRDRRAGEGRRLGRS